MGFEYISCHYNVSAPSYPWCFERINYLMARLRDACMERPTIAHLMKQVYFLATTAGDSCVTLVYARPLDDAWRREGEWLSECLECPIVGRPHEHHGPNKYCVDRNVVGERLSVNGRCLSYQQVANSFSQPNPGVASCMLSWADEVTSVLMDGRASADVTDGTSNARSNDLLELYCGNGNFAIAIAHNFRRCFATEAATELISLAQQNAELNGVTNLVVAVASAQDVSNVLRNGSRLTSMPQLEIGAVSTILIDPPREGLDSLTRKLVSRFDRIVYISCCPETLARDVSMLSITHGVMHVAVFDQFPYTPHLEMGLVLQRL